MLDRIVAPSVLVVCLGFGLCSSLSARERACHEPRIRAPIAGESIGLVYGPEIARKVVDEAIAVWRSCPNYRGDFPALVHGESTATIFVELASGTSGSKRCGLFRGRKITLYRWARTSDRSVRSCGSLALNLAHELGHALGLADAHETKSCRSTIMADLEPGNLFTRNVVEEECRLVGERWSTLTELALATERRRTDLRFGRSAAPTGEPRKAAARQPDR